MHESSVQAQSMFEIKTLPKSEMKNDCQLNRPFLNLLRYYTAHALRGIAMVTVYSSLKLFCEKNDMLGPCTEKIAYLLLVCRHTKDFL